MCRRPLLNHNDIGVLSERFLVRLRVGPGIKRATRFRLRHASIVGGPALIHIKVGAADALLLRGVADRHDRIVLVQADGPTGHILIHLLV